MKGFNRTIHTSLIEAFLIGIDKITIITIINIITTIEIGPGRWHKAGITIEQGVSTILSVLSSQFHCYIIVRNFDSCPSTVYTKTSDDDVLLSGKLSSSIAITLASS